MEKSNTKKYSGILLKGSAAVTISEASTKLITLLLLPVFSFYLSPADFGTISMVSVIITTLSLFYNPGLTSATIRLYHDTVDIEERRTLIGSAQRFYLFFPLICTVLLILLGPFVFEWLFEDFAFYPFGLLAILLAFFSQTKNIWISMMMLQYRVTTTALYTFASVILGTLVSLFLVIYLELGALGKVLGMFSQILLIFVVAYFSVTQYTKGYWSFESIKKQLIFGIPLIGAIWSTSLLQVVDRFIIERMAGIDAVGMYSFAFQIAQIPLFLVTGIRKVWNPIFYENMNNHNYGVLRKLVYIYNVILSLICILIILFSKEFILLFIDARYYDAIPLISVLVIGVYFSGLLLVPNAALTYDKRFAITSRIAFFAIIIDIILNILLIPFLGVMGSTIATAIAYLSYFVMGFLTSRNITREITNLKNIIIPPLLVAGATTITLIVGNEWSWLELGWKLIYVATAVCFLFYVGSLKINDIKRILKKQ